MGHQDAANAAFQSKLIPTVKADRFLGVRTPAMRVLAKSFVKTDKIELFLEELPHYYFEENQLHAFVISEIKDIDACLQATERFLPFVDNWATCDQLSPVIFRKHRPLLLTHINRWLQSDHEYTVRFSIGMLMQHFLDDDFEPQYLRLVGSVADSRYYVAMMRAWFFATALAKQWAATWPIIESLELPKEVQNKTIQKAIESRRITLEQKELLRACRIK
ncbi:MAG: DNA alkylation repair protein [Muribaculaceae bacterium]|nr:DNA alkylation repair protein [Muribaculaceae bacterium]